MPDFDLSVHLVGDQPVPAYVAIKHLSAPLRLFVCSARTAAVASRVATAANLPAGSYKVLRVDPHDMVAIQEQLAAHPWLQASIAPVFDLTGGTKLMWAVGYVVSQATPNARSAYVETTRRQLWWLDRVEAEPLKPVMTVEAFVRLAGLRPRVGAPGPNPNPALASILWSIRRDFSAGQIQRGFVDLAESRRKDWVTDGQGGLRFESLGHEGVEVRRGKVVLWRTDQGWPEAAAYFGGRWLEDYTLATLEPLRGDSGFRELFGGLEVEVGGQSTYQELDVVACDGYQLTVVECKAGSVTQAAIQKLENVVGELGGSYGRGLLVSSFPVRARSTSDQRILRSRTISAFGGDAVPNRLCEEALSVAPGVVAK